jgi:hypothetical protein
LSLLIFAPKCNLAHCPNFGVHYIEALAVCWVFPGKSIQIDAPCLDCGDPMRIVVRDGVIESQSPNEIQGYIDIPLKHWAKDWPYT